MSFKVPFRKKSAIEDMAIDLLRKYEAWKGSRLTPPIDIDDIVEGYLKIDLQLVDLKELLAMSDVLGATWFEDKIIRIDSSLEQKEGRLSFTMAHEVGHWWIHRPIYEMDKVTLPMFVYEEHMQPKPAIVCRSNRKKDPAEWQADQFAAMLLMPGSMMRVSISSLQGYGAVQVDDLENNRVNVAENPNLRAVAKQVIESAEFTNVSTEAMCYRLIDLNLVVDSNAQQGSFF